MNVFLHELRMYRKSTAIWTLSLAAVVVFFMSMFPALSRDVEAFTQLLAAFPESVRKAFGISVETIGSLLGYYAYVFAFISLAGAVQAMSLGVSLVSRESRDKTADFLLTKPVPRARIMTAKLLAAAASLAVVNAGFMAAAYAIASLVSTAGYNVKLFFMISITMLFVQLIFLALGLLVSLLAKKIKTVLPVSLGAVFAFYIINMLSSVTGDEKLRYLSPFQYFEPARIQMTGRYEITFLLIGAGFVIGAILASYVIYNKKDIHAV